MHIYMHWWAITWLVQKVAWCRIGDIIWTNAGTLSTGLLGTNISEILIEIQTVSLKEIINFFKLSSDLVLNVLKYGFVLQNTRASWTIRPTSALRALRACLGWGKTTRLYREQHLRYATRAARESRHLPVHTQLRSHLCKPWIKNA